MLHAIPVTKERRLCACNGVQYSWYNQINDRFVAVTLVEV